MKRGRDFSIGNDVVSVSRISSLIERRGDRFLNRCFTAAEIRDCRAKARPSIHFAGRWAAKEAVYKALRLEWNRPFSWKEIEIGRDSSSGAPTVRFSEAIRSEVTSSDSDMVRETRAGPDSDSEPEIEISLSISHCAEYAFATALVLRACGAGEGREQ